MAKKITQALLDEAKALSSTGLNNIQVAECLSLSVCTLSRNKELSKFIREGKLELSKRVTETILDNLDNDKDRLFLAKRLNLFSPHINIIKPTNSKEALNNLSIALKQFADGSINESQLRTVEAVVNSFIRGYDYVELEDRIKRLEHETLKR